MTRTWVYDKLIADTTLDGIVDGRIFAATAVQKAPEAPFIIYRQIADVVDFRGDDGTVTKTATYLIFAEDKVGDYLQIDSMLAAIAALFDGVSDQAEGIIRSTWLENSEDFRDEDMGTNLKYARIQVKYKAT